MAFSEFISFMVLIRKPTGIVDSYASLGNGYALFDYTDVGDFFL